MLNVFQILVILQQIGFTVAYIPQIHRLLKFKDSEDISIVYYLIRILSLIVLELVYCMLHNWTLIIANGFSIFPELWILWLVITNRAAFRKRRDKELYGY